MRILNATRSNTVLTEDVIVATSPKERMFGLLIHKVPQAILLYTRFGIHTFGLKYPIDILILNNEHTVVKKKKNLKPNSVFLWNPKFKIVIELPSNSIEKSKTQLDDNLTFLK